MKTGNKPSITMSGHDDEVFCIDFNPLEPNLFITGSADKRVMLWDLRKTDTHLATLEFHTDIINNV